MVAVIRCLAQRDLASGLMEGHFLQKTQNKGHFQKEVGLLAKCDTVMQQHIARVQSTVGYHPHYLGKTIH